MDRRAILPPSPPNARDRRAELLRWIADTQRTQKRGLVALGALVVICLGVMIWRATWGQVALGCVLATGGIGWWVTNAHLQEWRSKLDELARAENRRR